MSATVIYPLDLSGNSPANLVINEAHSVASSDTAVPYFFTKHGPFFADSNFELVNEHGYRLIEDKDFIFIFKFVDATIHAKKRVFGGILPISRSGLGNLSIQYQTLGDEFSFNETFDVENIGGDLFDLRRYSFDALINKPLNFPVVYHSHAGENDLTGMGDIAVLLDRIFRTMRGESGPDHSHSVHTILGLNDLLDRYISGGTHTYHREDQIKNWPDTVTGHIKIRLPTVYVTTAISMPMLITHGEETFTVVFNGVVKSTANITSEDNLNTATVITSGSVPPELVVAADYGIDGHVQIYIGDDTLSWDNLTIRVDPISLSVGSSLENANVEYAITGIAPDSELTTLKSADGSDIANVIQQLEALSVAMTIELAATLQASKDYVDAALATIDHSAYVSDGDDVNLGDVVAESISTNVLNFQQEVESVDDVCRPEYAYWGFGDSVIPADNDENTKYRKRIIGTLSDGLTIVFDTYRRNINAYKSIFTLARNTLHLGDKIKIDLEEGTIETANIGGLSYKDNMVFNPFFKKGDRDAYGTLASWRCTHTGYRNPDNHANVPQPNVKQYVPYGERDGFITHPIKFSNNANYSYLTVATLLDVDKYILKLQSRIANPSLPPLEPQPVTIHLKYAIVNLRTDGTKPSGKLGLCLHGGDSHLVHSNIYWDAPFDGIDYNTNGHVDGVMPCSEIRELTVTIPNIYDRISELIYDDKGLRRRYDGCSYYSKCELSIVLEDHASLIVTDLRDLVALAYASVVEGETPLLNEDGPESWYEDRRYYLNGVASIVENVYLEYKTGTYGWFGYSADLSPNTIACLNYGYRHIGSPVLAIYITTYDGDDRPSLYIVARTDGTQREDESGYTAVRSGTLDYTLSLRHRYTDGNIGTRLRVYCVDSGLPHRSESPKGYTVSIQFKVMWVLTAKNYIKEYPAVNT